ncbi:MAG: DDRRRQL repeat protein YjdP [Raoultella ornithinolytica]
MKRYFTALILCTLSLSSQLAHADIIDDAIGNIQQAISDAYNPGNRSSDDDNDRYDDGRYQGSRQQSTDRQRQYDDRQRQLEDRRRQLDDRQRQLDQDRRQLENDQRRLDDDY